MPNKDESALGAAVQSPLVTSPANGTWIGVAVALSLLIVASFALTMPFARLPTYHTEMLLPAYAAAILLLELITAALLFALYSLRRSPALLCLASGYLFSALLVPAWAISFPGVFTAYGIDMGLQTTAAIAALRRIGFPLFVLAYALAPRATRASTATGHHIALSLTLVLGGAALLLAAIISGSEALPLFMRDSRNVATLWQIVPIAALSLYLLVIALLLARRQSQLDIWVALVMFSLAVELLLISFLGGGVRLGVGWWAGRLYGLLAASIVLLVLLVESTQVYGRLARTIAAERRLRRSRLTAMEALSASIAHEINQPLTSMITNANAGLRWLVKSEPRLDRAEAALRHIVEDGHRASSIVTGIRSMFTKELQERTELDLNALVTAAVEAARSESTHEFIEIRAVLADDLPPVIGNAVQLGQVLRNLIENAMDALRGSGTWPRQVVVRTCHRDPDEVLVSVEDNGPGIAPEVAQTLFDPFVSTKPGGMGMGLMFCRAVVEAHGGRLWATPTPPGGSTGAVFQFSLPSAILPAHDNA
ncbi:MASE4 domain-containing protein [Ancylobacter sp. WKF20]|uniref:MASE4 domain-containing protein n=1 Tax=Ancylobacter sp. WKF20 TaxID=3039801 RepID=UPI00243426C0|nr:ATP-binding protein [Ancylobacter sp. WKF20]WGD32170.1 MASE4 domain-containing protein [Ancylobacter sp. WKF20]